jgi:acyl dehydratase
MNKKSRIIDTEDRIKIIIRKKIFKKKFDISEKLIHNLANTINDFNGLHMDKDTAVLMGFNKQIFHGVGLLGLLSSSIYNEFPGDGYSILSLNSKFNAPAYLDDIVIVKIELVKIYKLSNTAKFDFLITNHLSNKISSGDVIVKVP